MSDAAPAARSCVFVAPGDWSTLTGGYAYDRRIVAGLRDAGWHVDVVMLDKTFPRPDADALRDADRRLSAIDNGSIVVIDGLAFGAMPDVAEHHADRLALVALVHHPLHLETGLDESERVRLLESESRSLQTARLVPVASPVTRDEVVRMGVDPVRVVLVGAGTERVQGSGLGLLHGGQHADARPSPVLNVPEVGNDTARSQGRPIRLLCVATLTPRKGHSVLLEALAGLREDNWTLDCIGGESFDPATAAALKHQASLLNLDPKVRWHGGLPEHELAAWYDAADVFVLASLYEGFGLVVTEAVAHGLPVVATTAGALPTTLPAGAGVLVPPGDVGALREALASLIGDEVVRERLAAGARRAAAALPTWHDTSKAFAAALERLR